MIEAELKAYVRDPERVRQLLLDMAEEEVSVYRDTYYDWPDRSFTIQEREFRLRVVEANETTRCLLTYKQSPVDEVSQSKPEYETQVGTRSTMDFILRSLGLTHLVAFEKHCRNFALEIEGRQVLATLVRVPELDETFIEVETLVDGVGNVEPGLRIVRNVLAELKIDQDDITTVTYTSLVLRRREALGRLPTPG
jgi:adenylate cyclase class 2